MRKPSKKKAPIVLEKQYVCSVPACKRIGHFRRRDEDDIITGYCRDHTPSVFGMKETLAQAVAKAISLSQK